MTRSISAIICSFSVAFLLAACGGGGGGGGSDDSGPALRFDPKIAVANYPTGATQTINITATATRPKDFTGHTLYVFIIDGNQLLNGGVSLTPINDTSVQVSLETSPLTASGHYTGNFTVQLCKDPACAAEFPGSPVTLPYDFTVTP